VIPDLDLRPPADHQPTTSRPLVHHQEHHMSTLNFTVPGMTCGHCEAAVKGEIAKLAGVTKVDVDLQTKAVVVEGEALDQAAVFAAVDEAGFEAVV
jgi:copper chaperone CopZ